MVNYVDSNATGANDGTSWTDAWTSLNSAFTVAAGTEVRIAFNHLQTYDATQIIDFTSSTNVNPVTIRSSDPADDSYRRGAKIAQGATSFWDLIIQGSALYYGVDFDMSNDLNIGGTAATTTSKIILEDFNIVWVADKSAEFTIGSDNWGEVDFINGLIDFGAEAGVIAFGGIALKGGSRSKMTDVTIDNGSSTTTTLIAGVGVDTDEGATLTMDGCELIGFTSIFSSPGAANTVKIRRCKLPTGFAGGDFGFGTFLEVSNSAIGTITAPPLGLTHFEDSRGSIKSTLTRFRTGGADDGSQANAYAWEMVTSSEAVVRFIGVETPPISIWVDGGASKTFTIFVASGVTLTDEDFWIELIGPDDNVTTTGRGHYLSSRVDPRATASNLTTDGTSSWDGTGVGTKQKVSLTYTPEEDGPVSIRCFLAKASTTIYLDPKIEVT